MEKLCWRLDGLLLSYRTYGTVAMIPRVCTKLLRTVATSYYRVPLLE